MIQPTNCLAGAGASKPERSRPDAVFYDITAFTAQDFPDHLAAILWFARCDLRCSYCQNPDLLTRRGRISLGAALDFLEQRRGLLDGVVLTGGEPLINRHALSVLRALRSRGWKIKLDTNGMHPKPLAIVLAEGLADYIACDYKAPMAKLEAVAGGGHVGRYQQSVALLCDQQAIPVEFRTSYHSQLLSRADIAAIMADLDRHGFGGRYYLQQVRHQRTLKPLPPSGPVPPLDHLPHAQNFAVAIR